MRGVSPRQCWSPPSQEWQVMGLGEHSGPSVMKREGSLGCSGCGGPVSRAGATGRRQESRLQVRHGPGEARASVPTGPPVHTQAGARASTCCTAPRVLLPLPVKCEVLMPQRRLHRLLPSDCSFEDISQNKVVVTFGPQVLPGGRRLSSNRGARLFVCQDCPLCVYLIVFS